MLMAGSSHHPAIGILRAPPGSTMTATAAGAAAGSASTAARAAMERSCSGQDGQPLSCPRCDSSNTKFCYYNNYSLSQPRHFCKSCKRYWTRGGTLRNVPVGGGCRKNKRVKKHVSSSTTLSSTAITSSSADPAPMPPLSYQPNPNPIASVAATASSPGLGSLFYGHASDLSHLAFLNPCVPYDLQSLDLFPSNVDEERLPVLKTHLTDQRILQQTAPPASTTPSLSSLLHDCPLFGSNIPLTSFHAPSLKPQQQQRMAQNPNLSQYTTLISHATGQNSTLLNDVKMEGDGEGMTSGSTNQYRFNWQIPSCESVLLETVATESSLYWNAAAGSAFGDGALQ